MSPVKSFAVRVTMESGQILPSESYWLNDQEVDLATYLKSFRENVTQAWIDGFDGHAFVHGVLNAVAQGRLF
jgi:hypothetical protein